MSDERGFAQGGYLPSDEPIDVGDLIEVFVVFSDAEEAEAEPTTVELVIRKPDGTQEIVDEGFTHDEEEEDPVSGRYSLDIAIDQSGRWYAEWRGTGAVTAVEPLHWFVRSSMVSETGS